jgi:hypothetical protein
MASAVAILLSQSPPVVARSNAVPTLELIGGISGPFETCQRGETLPAGTTAIRLSLESMFGPRVAVRVLGPGGALTAGEVASGWGRQSVTVPVQPRPRTVAGVDVCFAFAPKDETVLVRGAEHGPGTGRFRVEYLRPGTRTWWALAAPIARHMALGRAAAGIWVVFAAAAGMLAVAGVASWGALQDPR